ncbi:hypothetical protein CDAR_525881 [Caerostris darwini]|uniref:Uncharacterized protein n=1 Tax=Caerostris darwini TaxID=1538125 RepID=A0AAV4S1D2_9ARAC|nr:hypothetical protein CDAR_525881 [Caerostris darwini]
MIFCNKLHLFFFLQELIPRCEQYVRAEILAYPIIRTEEDEILLSSACGLLLPFAIHPSSSSAAKQSGSHVERCFEIRADSHSEKLFPSQSQLPVTYGEVFEYYS